MGIQGLLPFLREASVQINLSELKNYTVAIDSYCWLHKGAFGCAEKLARGEDTDGYVLYCLKYIKMLQQYNIKPIMVFDGQHLPAKKATELKRRQQRQQNKKQAQDLLLLGKTSEAYSYIRRSIDITHKMALNLIKTCRNMGIDCIVAPYEADAQLAYLSMAGVCQAVISEDSDLVLFGCKKIIYKLDLQETATMVDAEKLPVSMKLRPDNYTFDKFRYMCILSGCDYLDSLPGIGIKKALKFISMTANPSIYDVLPKLPSYLKLKDIVVTNEYRRNFMVADATFRHQIVYDPLKRKLTRLTDPDKLGTKEEYLENAGKFYDEELAFNMALGNIDPFSLEVLDDWKPSYKNINSNSIWAESYTKPRLQGSITAFTNIKSAETKIVATKTSNDVVTYQEEENLQEELKVYLLRSSSSFKRKREEENKKEDETIREEPTSPVLNKDIYNPFRKISKFNRTVTSTNKTQISRFFSKRTSTESIVNESHEVNSEITQVKELNTETIVVEKQMVNVCQTAEDIKEDESDLENLTPPTSQNIEVQTITEDATEKNLNLRAKSTSRNTQSKNTTNKSSKLSRTSSSSNQRTILSMFKFAKPPSFSNK